MSADDRRPASPPAPADASGDGDERAKDILKDQPHRPTLGERLSRRVGARRFERAPIVSCTGKLFARYELADPWDPDSADRPLALGPVAMKFEERRQPAPHARVKEPKKKGADRPAWTPPKGIPDARSSKPKPAAAAARSPAPARADKPQAAAPAAKDQPRPMPPVAPPPKIGKAAKKSASGRFRMRPTSTSGPRVRQVQRVVEAPAADRDDSPASSPDPPPRQPQSLDDLFGAMGGGRDKRVGRKKD